MRFVGHGHAAIRATHDKTLEFSLDADITARATCVVMVGTDPQPAEPMAGTVRVRISAGGERFTFDALANSQWEPGGPAVIRRSPLRLPGTFATDASASSADLPRELVAALQRAGELITVDVAARPSSTPTLVLFAADAARASDASLRAELAAADVVFAEDDGARALIGHHEARPGGRTLIVATCDLPGARMWTHLNAVPERIETVGLAPRLAAAAASGMPGALLFPPKGAHPRDVLRRAPATVRPVVETAPGDLPGLLAFAAETRATTGATIAQACAPPRRVTDADAIELPSRDPVYICFDPATESTALDPAVRLAVDGLLIDGTPTKAAARALAALTGWDRRRAYDTVLHWRE